MEKALISVVVPVYKVEKYLKRCVESIVKQTYDNLEIILVDDGSPDGCPEICDQYAEKDARIHVYHKSNGGLSDARNVGIEKATGKYITFVDSDDYVSCDYVEYLYNLLRKSDADISIVCNKKIWSYDEKLDDVEHQETIFSNTEAMEALFYQKFIENSAWAKLYKKELFDVIRYPKGRLYEDLGTTYKLFFNASKIIWSNEQKYYYFQRESSIMSKAFTEKNMDRIAMSEEILDFVRDNCCEIEKAAVSRFFISNIQVLRELPLENQKYQNCCKEICENIKKYRKEVVLDSKAKTITRLIALSSFMPFWLMQKLGAVYKKIYK